MNVVFFIGAITTGLYFMYQGLKVQLQFNEMSSFVQKKGVKCPRLATHLGSAMMAIGGLLLCSVAFAFFGCLLLFTFLLLANVTVHQFWKREELERSLSNFGLIGLILMIIATSS